jgi:hypothetical protein
MADATLPAKIRDEDPAPPAPPDARVPAAMDPPAAVDPPAAMDPPAQPSLLPDSDSDG